MKINATYHAHTFRCHHASGDVKEYAAEAVRQGGRILGATDHTPMPDGRWAVARMTLAELPGYLAAIEEARAAFPSLTIHRGLECEWVPDFEGFYRDELLGHCGFDYLIGAEHWFPYGGAWLDLYDLETPAHLSAMAGNLVSAMESGLFLFIAHPDNFGIGYIRWDENAEACAREIISAAARTGIPLEINGYGFRKDPIKGPRDGRRMYPIDRFWEIAAETGGIRVVCNSDAHTPADVYASIAQCREIADRFGLEYADLEGEIERRKGDRQARWKPFPVNTPQR